MGNVVDIEARIAERLAVVSRFDDDGQRSYMRSLTVRTAVVVEDHVAQENGTNARVVQIHDAVFNPETGINVALFHPDTGLVTLKKFIVKIARLAVATIAALIGGAVALVTVGHNLGWW